MTLKGIRKSLVGDTGQQVAMCLQVRGGTIDMLPKRSPPHRRAFAWPEGNGWREIEVSREGVVLYHILPSKPERTLCFREAPVPAELARVFRQRFRVRVTEAALLEAQAVSSLASKSHEVGLSGERGAAVPQTTIKWSGVST